MTGLKWTKKTTAKIAEALNEEGFEICAQTVAKLLYELDYRLRVNHKKLARTCQVEPELRNAQFERIAALREQFAERDLPVICVDTKKKEWIGCFKNNGVTWCKEPRQVLDHDFPKDALCKAIPYGIYDTRANEGMVVVGHASDTGAFAAESVAHWWRTLGKPRYPHAQQVLILADSGGSNGPTNRLWLRTLYEALVLGCGLTIRVAHYPAGASKWNPIDHRLFSAISKNWQGRPLDSMETMLNYIRTTTTKSGLKVHAHETWKPYPSAIRIYNKEFNTLPIIRDRTCPKWNYTVAATSDTKPQKCEVIVE